MSRPRCDVCPDCGLTYDDFRAGFSFAEVVAMLFVDDPDPSRWRYRRRNTILGHLHQLKREAWADHLATCSAAWEPVIPGALAYCEVDR